MNASEKKIEQREWKHNILEKFISYSRDYYQPKRKNTEKKRKKNKRHANTNRRIIHHLGSQKYLALKGNVRLSSTNDLLGIFRTTVENGYIYSNASQKELD